MGRSSTIEISKPLWRAARANTAVGAVRQDVLEEAVIQSLLEFYQDFRGRGGHARIAKLINEQIGATHQQVKAKRKALASAGSSTPLPDQNRMPVRSASCKAVGSFRSDDCE